MSRCLTIAAILLTVLTGANAPVFADGWDTEVVAPFGNHADLAVDADGNPHIVFNNCVSWELCLPTPTGTRELTYATNDGSGWRFETVAADPAGFLTSIVIDGFGKPHVAYCDSTWQMHYGYRDAGVWTLENLYHPVPSYYRASPSLVLDASGAPHIAFIERESIQYAQKAGGPWTDEDVTYSWLDNWSARAAIVIDSADTPRIGSWEYYASAVLYTRGVSDWSSDYVGGAAGYNPWMVLDDNDAAHFVYHGSGVHYATNAGGGWLEELIDPQGSNESNDIALDAAGRPFVVYTRAWIVTPTYPYLFNLELYLAWRDTSGWNTDLIASADSADIWFTDPRVEIDDFGVIHALYREPDTDALRYGTRTVPTAVGDSPAFPVPNSITRVAPNPFNPSTEVTFRIALRGWAALSVYDVTGRPVRVLADGGFPPGEYTVHWDGTTASGAAAPSGVYFFRLKTATATHTRRAVLTK